MEGLIPSIVFTLLSAGLFLAVLRVWLGPSLPDRVVALDLVGMLVGAALAAIAFFAGQTILLDVLLVFSILLFLGTVMFAIQLERSSDGRR